MSMVGLWRVDKVQMTRWPEMTINRYQSASCIAAADRSRNLTVENNRYIHLIYEDTELDYSTLLTNNII